MDVASALASILRKCLISECSSLGHRCQAHRVSGADRGAVGRWLGERGITTAGLEIVAGMGQAEAFVGEQVPMPWDGGMTVAYPPRAAERGPRPAAAAGIAASSSSSTWPVSTSVMIRRATASNSATTGLVSE
jgi:hypothetical protein